MRVPQRATFIPLWNTLRRRLLHCTCDTKMHAMTPPPSAPAAVLGKTLCETCRRRRGRDAKGQTQHL